MMGGVERPAPTLVHFGRRSLARFVELEGFDRSMALAGQAFAALLPLLIVCGTVAHGSTDEVADDLIARFDVSGSAADTLREAVAQPPDSGVSVVGVVLLVVSALSFTRAMQRLYVRAWRLEKLGVRGNLWGLLWLAAFIAYWSLQPAIVSLVDGALGLAVSLALSTALWLCTPWLLVAKRVSWPRLLPQAVLSAVSLAALAVGAAIYLPHAIASTSAEFGILGVAFTLLSLLFAVALVLVVTAALGATLADPRPASPRAEDAVGRTAHDD
jgi:membrane protein